MDADLREVFKQSSKTSLMQRASMAAYMQQNAENDDEEGKQKCAANEEFENEMKKVIKQDAEVSCSESSDDDENDPKNG